MLFKELYLFSAEDFKNNLECVTGNFLDKFSS